MLQQSPTLSASDALAAFRAGVTAMVSADLAGLDAVELMEVLGEFEDVKRRLAPADHVLVAEIDERRLASNYLKSNLVNLLVGSLRISRREATRRVNAARALGPRRSLLGEVLPARYPVTAAAQVDGSINAEHAAVITTTIDRLPRAVDAAERELAEVTLVGFAEDFDPDQLRRLARRLSDVIDPDGILADDADRAARRAFTLLKHRDGSSTPRGELDPELTALLLTLFDTLAKPVKDDTGQVDERNPAQRRHDALTDALRRLLRSDTLPSNAGLATTLILMADVNDAQNRIGFAQTSHGDLIPMRTALQMAAGDSQTFSVVFDAHGAVLDYGQTLRLAPPDMRLAAIARDRGCTVPGCSVSAAWTEAHHVKEFVADLGPTAIDNIALACTYHHRHFRLRGWSCEMIDGIPHWTKPPWLDPTQTPERNYYHHPELLIKKR